MNNNSNHHKFLLEDFFENNITKDDIQSVSLDDDAAVNPKNFKHSITVIASFPTISDAKKMRPKMRMLCRRLDVIMRQCASIKHYVGEIRTTKNPKDYNKWPSYSGSELDTEPISSADPGRVLDAQIGDKENIKKRASILFEVKFSYDYKENLTQPQAFQVLKTFILLRETTREFTRKYCAKDISSALILDGRSFNPHLEILNLRDNTIDMFLNIIGSYDDANRKYIISELDEIHDSVDDNFTVPEHILKYFKKEFPDSIMYLSKLELIVRVDDEAKTIVCKTPSEVTVGVIDLQYIASVFNYWNNETNDEPYEIQFEIQGSLVVEKMLKWLKNRMSMIRYVHILESNSTPITLLNKNILVNTFVDELVLNNVEFNSYQSSYQSAQIYPQSWKNPDVKISSPDAEIEIKQENNKTLLIAKTENS